MEKFLILKVYGWFYRVMSNGVVESSPSLSKQDWKERSLVELGIESDQLYHIHWHLTQLGLKFPPEPVGVAGPEPVKEFVLEEPKPL